MAVTFAVTGLVRNVVGNQRKHSGTITCTGTTTDNGDPITPAAVGLHTIAALDPQVAMDSNSNPEAAFGVRYIPTDPVTGGVFVFYTADGTTGDALPLTVVTDGTSVSTYSFQFDAYGT